MRIEKIKINGFGKINKKEIDFRDGINIVYGENEVGKSTILKFISSMLYGISKIKNGKSISDFEKYTPWCNDEFSGKIKYTLDDESEYEIFRDFKKRNTIIYNEFGKDISKEFCIDKTKGISYFEEQTGVNEHTFFKTVAIEQNNVRLDKSDTNSLVQKMSNFITTGDDNISFKKSLDRLNKMQTENIGSDRTKQRPINIVNENIDELLSKEKMINFEIQNLQDNQERKNELNKKIYQEQLKKEMLMKLKELDKLKEINNSKLEIEDDLLRDYFCKVNELREKINNKSYNNKKIKTKFHKILFSIFFVCLVIISTIICFVLRNIVLSLIPVIPTIVLMIYMVKKNFEEKKELDKTDLYLKREYDIAIEKYEKKKKEIVFKEKYFENEIKNKRKEIADKYKKKINPRVFEKMLDEELDLDDEIDLNQGIINEINVQIRLLQNEKANIDEKLQELTKIEEELAEQRNIKEELESLNESYNLAKECLEKAYTEVQQNISPKFQEKLCDITSNITNKKYRKIILNDETGLCVEVENGSYMPISLLSTGTIDEMFLSLRLSTLEELSKENIPIILDETFAYFDDERLKNVLLYLQDTNYDKQIIIFTCTNREIMVLNELKIEYNLITLE